MSCALSWDVGPGTEPGRRDFRFVVRVDRTEKAEIEKRARAAGLSPDRYAQQLFDAALKGDVGPRELPAPVTPQTLAAFAARHRVTHGQAKVFSVLEAMAVDGVFSGATDAVADQADTTPQTVLTAYTSLVRAGLLERLPRPGRSAVLRLRVGLR